MSILGKAIQIDREEQWGQLISICRDDHDSIILFHGHIDQGLVHFVERVAGDLSPLTPGGVDVHRVPFYSQGGQQPPTAFEWLRRVGALLNRPGLDLEDAVRQASDETRLVLVFEAHLPPPPDRRIRSLLRAFVRDEASKLLKNGRGFHPIHLVLAIDYAHPDPDYLDGFNDLLPEGFVALPELSFPDWKRHVRPHLQKERVPLEAQAIMEEYYIAMVAAGLRDYRVLAAAVQAIHDGKQPPPLPPPRVTHLPSTDLEAIARLAIDLGLHDRREMLRRGLPATLVAGIKQSPHPSDQLRLDLDHLNGIGGAAGLDRHPLAIWLANAEGLVDPRPEAEIFARQARRLRRP